MLQWKQQKKAKAMSEKTLIDTDNQKTADNAEINFVCEGKCRICPFPGANCTEQLIQDKGERHAKRSAHKF